MNLMTVGVILSTVALLVQGTRCLMRQGAPPFVRRFGALTLLLAGLSARLVRPRPVRRGRPEPRVRHGDGTRPPAWSDSPRLRAGRRGRPGPARSAAEGGAAGPSGGAPRPGRVRRAAGDDAHHDPEPRGGRVPGLRLRSLVAAAPRVGERVLPGRRDHDRGGAGPPDPDGLLRPPALRPVVGGDPSGVLHRPDIVVSVDVALPRQHPSRPGGAGVVRARGGGRSRRRLALARGGAAAGGSRAGSGTAADRRRGLGG